MSLEERTHTILYSGRFDHLTVAQARAVIESDRDLSSPPVTKSFYFGCMHSAGHSLWPEKGQSIYAGDAAKHLPWKSLDGEFNPNEVQGQTMMRFKGGWTALGFADRSVDSRPGSNSIFFFNSRLSFDEAVAEAKKRWPQVMGRISFELIAPSTNL